MKEQKSPLIRISGGVLGYRNAPILQNVDFELFPGEFYPLLGLNGSGKSTFLKTVVGILPLLEGTFEQSAPGGELIRVGYIPQSEKLDPIFPLSVTEVVLMGTYSLIRPGRFVRQEHHNIVRRCLRETEVEFLADKRFSTLSGGQKQRVLLARALASQPELLVLDEPTAGIDVQGEKRITEMIRSINQQHGVAVLMASHNLKIVQEFSPRLIWVHDGGVSLEETEKIVPAYGLTL